MGGCVVTLGSHLSFLFFFFFFFLLFSVLPVPSSPSVLPVPSSSSVLRASSSAELASELLLLCSSSSFSFFLCLPLFFFSSSSVFFRLLLLLCSCLFFFFCSFSCSSSFFSSFSSSLPRHGYNWARRASMHHRPHPLSRVVCSHLRLRSKQPPHQDGCSLGQCPCAWLPMCAFPLPIREGPLTQFEYH